MSLAEHILHVRGAVIQNDHFVYKSGKHGRDYVNKDAIYPYTGDVSTLCRLMARYYAEHEVEVVIGPEVGAVVLAHRVAEHLSEFRKQDVLAVYAEKSGEDFIIKRGFELIVPKRRTLVVEDILTTGGTARKVVNAAKGIGGIVIGVAALVNRGGVTAEQLDVDLLETLVNVDLKMYPEAECPACAESRPINTQLGHGRDFLAQRAIQAVK